MYYTQPIFKTFPQLIKLLQIDNKEITEIKINCCFPKKRKIITFTLELNILSPASILSVLYCASPLVAFAG